jgi:hypothetical protein
MIFFNIPILSIFSPHISGKFARTSASANGGGTALPHLATSLLKGSL